MGIFGGEKYSKEAYKDAKAEAASAEKVEKNAHVGEYPGLSYILKLNTAEAKKRLEKLHGKGQSEANALNEEYDRLNERLQEAGVAVIKFQKDKLGMSDEDES